MTLSKMGAMRVTAGYLGGWNTDEEEDSGVAISADRFFLEYLQNASNIDMTVDGSSVTQDFTFTVPASQQIEISRCNIYIQDAGPTPTEFGGIPTLTNGLLVEVLNPDDSVLKGFNAARPIMDNSDFVSLGGTDVQYQLGTGVDSVTVRWTLPRHSGGQNLLLRENETFRVRVRDNLTGLTAFRWVLQGQSLV